MLVLYLSFMDSSEKIWTTSHRPWLFWNKPGMYFYAQSSPLDAWRLVHYFTVPLVLYSPQNDAVGWYPQAGATFRRQALKLPSLNAHIGVPYCLCTWCTALQPGRPLTRHIRLISFLSPASPLSFPSPVVFASIAPMPFAFWLFGQSGNPTEFTAL